MSLPTPATSSARRVLLSAVLAAIALLLLCPCPAAAQPKMPPIVERASAYVAAFVTRFSNIVAEERYVQQTEHPAKKRELLSDYLFVNPPGNLARRILDVQTAAARFNLEDIVALDKPLVALSFLQPVYVDRFAYTVGRMEPDLGPAVRVVQFREIVRPTLLHENANRDLPTHGFYWIDEDSGRVVKTTLDFRANYVTTTFRFDPELRLDVPDEMTQRWYVGRNASTEFTATSTYGRFRRFGVQTEEKIR